MNERVEPEHILSAGEETRIVAGAEDVTEVSGEGFLGSWGPMVPNYPETSISMSTKQLGY